MLGILDRSRGCLFDLDGVLTQTSVVDGVVAGREGLAGKPAPDSYLREAGADVVVRDLAELLDER